VEKNFLDAVKPSPAAWAERELSGTMTDRVFGLLGQPDFKTDRKLPQLKYLHRTMKDADLFFIFNESRESISFTPSFGVKGEKQIWDAATGNIASFKGSSLSLGPWETKFILIKR
jgi:alpha-L-rhamnosidase